MERLSFEAITTAKPISFKVGPDEREFYLHGALVASLSEPLNAIINGSFAEASTGVVAWPDVDEASFVHFTQFAYTGSYHVQEIPSVKPSDDIAAGGSDELVPSPPPDQGERATEWAAENISNSGGDLTVGIKKKKKKTSSMWVGGDAFGTRAPQQLSFQQHFQVVFDEAFAEKKPPELVSDQSSSMPKDSNSTRCYSYGDIFMAHATLFVFADCYQIDQLANAALGNFHRSLTGSNAEAGDIVQLFEYCVETPVPDALWQLVLVYITCNFKLIWSNARFQELLKKDSNRMHELLSTIFEVVAI